MGSELLACALVHSLMYGTLVAEHVWQVTVLNKGLGNTRNMLGRHLLCLTDRSLSLVKLTQEERAETYEFSVRVSVHLILPVSFHCFLPFLLLNICVAARECPALWALRLLLLHGGGALLLHW